MKAIFAACTAFFGLIGATQAQESTWIEQKTTADDGTNNTYFGTSAFVGGGLAVVGAYGDNGFRGAAYVMKKAGKVWSQAQKIVADDALGGDEFGYRTTFVDGRLFVTAFTATVGTNTSQGAAYVFELDRTRWNQVQKLVADDGAVFDSFGQSVAVDGTNAVIGANGATVDGEGAQGAAYVFVRSDSGWSQVQKLVADNGDTVDNFGVSAAIKDGTIFIGSPYAAVNGHSNQGAVYVYTQSGATWTQVQEISGSDGGANDTFGMSMAFDGTTLIVGATGADGSGAAYVFTQSGGVWTETQKLAADDAGSGDNFGDAIAMHGSDVLIGSDVSTVDGDTSRGAAYLFSAVDGVWTQSHKFVASDGTTDDFFGAAVGFDGDTAVISTPHPVIDGHAWQGAAYFYSRDTLFADGFDG